MYVTAQTVQAESGEEAIHVFVYLHRNTPVSDIDWSAPDAGFLAEHCPGQLMLAVRTLSGKLAVRSFLDVAFPDVLAKQGAMLLRQLIAAWPAGPAWPNSWNVVGVGGRFYIAASRRANAAADLKGLQEALLSVLGEVVPRQLNLPALSVPVAQPLVVVQSRTAKGLEFRLDDTSRGILTSLGVAALETVMSVSLANYDAFEAMTGRDIEDEVVPALTKLTIEQIDALGGAEVVENRMTVWVSPALAAQRR